jgi:lipopolysaccharide export system permease protein
MMLTLLDRYIARRVMIATALVLGVLIALMVLFSFIAALPDFGKGSFGLPQLLRYVLFSQPSKLYEIFPVAMLIGALLGLSALAVNSELVAMRAAGVSVWRIVAAAMKVGLMFAVLALAWGEFVVPVAEHRAQIERARAVAHMIHQQPSGLWLRDTGVFINIGEVLPDLSLLRVNLYAFDRDTQLRAERASYTGNGWRLEEIRESHITQSGIQTRRVGDQFWSTGLTQDMVAAFAVRPEELSIQHLLYYIQHLRNNGQSTEQYRLALWQKVLMPLTVAVMVLLATPFAFGPIRTGGMSQRIFAGVMLGLGFMVISRIFGHFGLIYGLPPVLGVMLPIALFLIGTLFLLRRVI